MHFHLIVQGLLILAIAIDVGLLIVLTRHQLRSLSQKLLFIHIFGILAWTVSILILLNTGSVVATQIAFASAMVFGLAKYYFSCTFPDKNLKINNLNIIPLLLGVAMILVSFIPDTLFSNLEVVNSTYINHDIGSLSGVYSLLIIYLLIAPVFILLYKLRHTKEIYIREQITYLSFGMSLAFIISLGTNIVLPVFFNIDHFNGLGPFFSVILTGFMVYIITRHNFLELQTVLQRGLIYSILFGFIVLIYASLLSVTHKLLPTSGVFVAFISSLTTIIIGIIIAPKIDGYLREKTDNIFFKGSYRFREVIHELSTILHSSLDMDELINACEQKLKAVLRAKSVTITTKNYNDNKADLCIPIKLKDKLIGMIVIGPKTSGDQYNNTDKQLLHTFANQAATGMSRIFLYQEVKRHAEELEVKVTERTKELQLTQEQQKEMMLHISHNLQTPLAILQNKIDSLRKNVPESIQLDSLEQSLGNVSEFIRNLLRLARLEAQHEEIKLQTCCLSELLEDISDEIQIIAVDKSIVVKNEIERKIMTKTDPHKLREIVMNLLSNAIKYMGDSKDRQITIKLTQTSEGTIINIIDSGIGIIQEDVEKVFTSFYRGIAGSKNKGTGLGLAITKQLVQQLGGKILLRSKLGEGSSFTVIFPTSGNQD